MLGYLERQLPTAGRIITVFPNRRFYEYAKSYQRRSKIWELINRGRNENIKWTMDLEEFERELKRRTCLTVEKRTRYLCRLTLETWDIGLRPISPHLIKMANSLTPTVRQEIKGEWCETLAPFVENLMENELEKGAEEGAFNLMVLRKEKETK